MKLGLVTKIDKRKKATSEKFNDDITSENCDVTDIFFNLRPIWNNAEAGFRTHSL